MPDKVFIGSTGQDLKEYRQAAIEVCNQLSLVPIAMEFFEAMGAGATKGCRQKVDEADLYVGIFAHRYGYIEEGHEKSVTEDEFDYAGERELDRLCYLVDPKHDWPPDSIDFEQYDKLKAFKARIDKSVIREEFTSVDDFQAKLTRALVAWKEKQEGYRRGVIETRKNAEEAARLREIESKDRAARIFRRWAAVATVWGVIAAGAGVLAYQNSQLAFSRELAAASTLNLESDPELSVRLALHAIQEVPETDEARTALHQALMSSRVRFTLQGGRVLNTVAFSHDGSRLAAAGEAQHVELWDTETQEKRQCCEHGGTVHAVAFSPDGSRLATASANEDQTAKVWNTHSGEQLLTLSGHQEQISDVAFSPDGTRLAHRERRRDGEALGSGQRREHRFARSRRTRECGRF